MGLGGIPALSIQKVYHGSTPGNSHVCLCWRCGVDAHVLHLYVLQVNVCVCVCVQMQALPIGCPPPFGGQTLQVVLDRLNFNQLQQKFMTSSLVLEHSVLVTQCVWSSDKQHKKFMLLKLLPIADRVGPTSLLHHVTFDRAIKKGTGASSTVFYNPRGGKIFASRDGLCAFLAALFKPAPNPLQTKGLRVAPSTTGFYWEHFNAQKMFVHPYFDIDIKGDVRDEQKFFEVFPPIAVAIKLVNEFITNGTDIQQVKVLIVMNHRHLPGGKYKWSLHVHWPQVVVTNMTDMSYLITCIASQLPVGVTGQPLLDTKPYSSNQQLFRMPYCGKMGEGGCDLQPIRVYQDADLKWNYEPSTTDAVEVINQSCICTAFNQNFTELRVNSIVRQFHLPSQSTVDIVQRSNEDLADFERWMAFWRPVLTSIVVPNFIKYRQQAALKLNVACAFPDTTDMKLPRINRLLRFAASFRIELEGDTFCEYDNGPTPYAHSFGSNATSYVVDLHHGRIAQQCVKCRPTRLNWHCFIATGKLTFPVMSEKQAKCEADEFVTVGKNGNIIPFVLTYFTKTILFARDTKQVYIFDDDSGLWKNGSDGNRLLLAKINLLNGRYQAYCEARNMFIRDTLYAQYVHMNPGDDDEQLQNALTKMTNDCRTANNKVGGIWKPTIAARKDLLSSLKPDQHLHQVNSMEPGAHLVPLEGGVCLDIYTWINRKIRPTDYFISAHSASLIHLDDNEVVEFVKWQLQVCCGDAKYVEYKLRIMGLSLTHLDFDRSFYMPHGPVGRNGKSSESFLFNEVTMKASPARGYYMSREYLTNKGQDRKGANAADSVMMDMANKTIIIADECRDTPLDGSLIKSLVSGDRASARNLYEGERTNIEVRGKLWIIANKALKLDYADAALMDRMRILPYNARWVRNPAAVIAQMSDLPSTMYVFRDDPYFKEKTLKNWGNAMVTASLHALHVFLANLKRDPDNLTRPLKLETFPVPKCVAKATKENIEREHPVLNFVRMYMGRTASSDVADYVTVEFCFGAYQRFGKNENSGKIKYTNRTSFQEDMLKMDFSVIRGDDEVYRFKGWKMTKEVPNLDSSDLVDVGSFYQPAHVAPGDQRANKRHCPVCTLLF